jgi:hypothetical protein
MDPLASTPPSMDMPGVGSAALHSGSNYLLSEAPSLVPEHAIDNDPSPAQSRSSLLIILVSLLALLLIAMLLIFLIMMRRRRRSTDCVAEIEFDAEPEDLSDEHIIFNSMEEGESTTPVHAEFGPESGGGGDDGEASTLFAWSEHLAVEQS